MCLNSAPLIGQRRTKLTEHTTVLGYEMTVICHNINDFIIPKVTLEQSERHFSTDPHCISIIIHLKVQNKHHIYLSSQQSLAQSQSRKPYPFGMPAEHISDMTIVSIKSRFRITGYTKCSDGSTTYIRHT